MVGSSKATRIVIVAVGLFLLIIIGTTLSSVFFTDKTTPVFIKVAQDQNEISRVSQSAANDADADSTKQFAATTRLSADSAQSDLVNYLKAVGTKVKPAQLQKSMNPQTDTRLATAKAASLYDATYYSITKQQLEAYAADLQAAFKLTHQVKLQGLLQQDYAGTQLLLTQLAVNTTP